ncbi:Hypothetical predicted protein [Cloeon dipterum]|uniref:Uncharacterized protein n=1 Tax=Cloeon dipterum TaxID=197152 RepID=A0A8S1D3E7_9INSE|nr:Hypothetical predicted protein [Cloeon dipterum]
MRLVRIPRAAPAGGVASCTESPEETDRPTDRPRSPAPTLRPPPTRHGLAASRAAATTSTLSLAPQPATRFPPTLS